VSGEDGYKKGHKNCQKQRLFVPYLFGEKKAGNNGQGGFNLFKGGQK